ncbi:hypothetical protein HMPREF3113_11340 [Stenotrophomonas sp. HMSC10F06]|uniref:DUF4279 domain-containing protein n=1 Tax=Stenotrophomonas sp. HMSC10F06 TaxID=1581081 RepID=UPI0008A38A65|nr:DUF4279 domain-containing protein [Stenotrophomonas sp. HMSC10F06]OFS93315.1 hypothetical protein HMPREF3113_11340 [Stenotrophomonas sp. HMSC10F06]
MAAFDHSLAALRFFGDELVPDEISALLGANPTVSYQKGQELVGSRTGVKRVAKTGSWRLEAAPREPEDLEAQTFEILEQLTQDLTIWASLARFEPNLFCGLFMGSGNDGISLSGKALLAIGQRGIELGLDIYDAVEDDSDSVS